VEEQLSGHSCPQALSGLQENCLDSVGDCTSGAAGVCIRQDHLSGVSGLCGGCGEEQQLAMNSHSFTMILLVISQAHGVDYNYDGSHVFDPRQFRCITFWWRCQQSRAGRRWKRRRQCGCFPVATAGRGSAICRAWQCTHTCWAHTVKQACFHGGQIRGTQKGTSLGLKA
jgi:hypothetical protein